MRMLMKNKWVLLLLIVAATTGSRIADIGANLGRALDRSIELENETFTQHDSNVTNVMEVHFDPRGMQGLYNITKLFMDLVQKPDTLLPEDLDIRDPSNIDIQDVVNKIPSLLKQYAGILSLTIIAILFIALMPLVGLIFCCCRCCGKCGARSRPFDKHHDTCRKVVLAMFLIAVATLILFGVVCSFVTNQHMEDGITELPQELRQGVVDIRSYLNDTDQHISTLFVINFSELQKGLIKMLKKSSMIISEELSEVAKAISFKNLVEFVNGLDDMSQNLTYMKQSTNTLRVNASMLSDGLRRIKNDLLHTLNACKECSDVKDKVSRMNTTIDFDKLPDVTAEINNLQNIIDDGKLQGMMNNASDSFNSIEKNIKKNINDNIPEVERAIEDAGNTLKDTYKTIQNFFHNMSDALGRPINKTSNDQEDYIDIAQRYINDYSKYRFYVGIGESCVLLAIILCITLGLMCGVCGKRPDGYDDDCCNKGSGSRFLMFSVFIMFFFAAILMIATLAYFLTGFLTQRFICDTLRDPDSQMFKLIDEIAMKQANLYSNLSTTIKKCHQSETAYVALNLEVKMHVNDFGDMLNKSGVTEKIKEFKNKIKINSNITIFSDDTKTELENLKKSGIADINFDRFKYVLEHNITSIDLNDLVQSLKQLENKTNNTHMKMSIKQNTMYLQMYQKNLVEPMIETANNLSSCVENIQTALSLNHSGSNFNDTLNLVEDEILQAQNYINVNGTEVIETIANDFATKFEAKLIEYINRVGNETVNKVGKCRPLSKVYNMTLEATCDKIFYPWNGFWVCVGWCLILFIPGIILSVKLATLYQKSDPYPGPVVEAEYLYDAYADRDNIPLNSRHKKNKKKKKLRNPTDMYDTRGGYPSEGTDVRPIVPRERDAPGGSSHPDTRYADMAPKHWDDYPNGGPPHYQSAPLATEYERPPPYYFPGPGERP